MTHPLFPAGLVDHINLCAGNPYSRDANSQEYHFTKDENGRCTAYTFESFSSGAPAANGSGTLTYDANGKLTQLLENDTISGEGTNTLTWNGEQSISYEEFYIFNPATGFIAQTNYPDSQATVDFFYDDANTHLNQAVMASKGNVTATYEYASYTVPA